MTTATAAETREVVESPEPGIYYDIPFDTYLAWDCLNHSLLKYAGQSMKAFRMQENEPEQPASDAIKIGSLIHAGRLEVLNVAQRYAVMPDYTIGLKNKNGEPYKSPRNTNAYREMRDEFERVNSDKTIVTQEQYEVMLEAVKAIKANEKACEMLEGDDGRSEVSIVCDCESTGIRCKARIDWLRIDSRKLTDLKSTRDCREFCKAIYNLNYASQAAFYHIGLRILTGQMWEVGFVAVENQRPFGCMAATLSSEWLVEGIGRIHGLLEKVAESRRTGIYPDYKNPEFWEQPRWARKSQEEPAVLTISGKPLEVR